MKSLFARKTILTIYILVQSLTFCQAGEVIQRGVYTNHSGKVVNYRLEKVAKVVSRKTGMRQIVPKLIGEADGGFSLFYPYTFIKYTYDKNGTLLAKKEFKDVIKGTYVNVGPDGSFSTCYWKTDSDDENSDVAGLTFYDPNGKLLKKHNDEFGRLIDCKYTSDGKYATYCFINAMDVELYVYKTDDGSLLKSFSSSEYCDLVSADNKKFQFLLSHVSSEISALTSNWRLIERFVPSNGPQSKPPSTNERFTGWIFLEEGAVAWSKGIGQVGWMNWPMRILGEMKVSLVDDISVVCDAKKVFYVRNGDITTVDKYTGSDEGIYDLEVCNGCLLLYRWDSKTSKCYVDLLGVNGVKKGLLVTGNSLLGFDAPAMSCNGKYVVISTAAVDTVYKLSCVVSK